MLWEMGQGKRDMIFPTKQLNSFAHSYPISRVRTENATREQDLFSKLALMHRTAMQRTSSQNHPLVGSDDVKAK
jgi:hypothetical protein